MPLTADPFPGGGGTPFWIPDLGYFVAGGADATGTILTATSLNGLCWTQQAGPAGMIQVRGGIAWSPDLGLLVAAGNAVSALATSPDGVTWTDRTSPLDGGAAGAIVWVEDLGLFVAGGRSVDYSKCIVTSPDGITWTARTSPFDGVGTPTQNGVVSFAWSPTLGVLVAGGVTDGAGTPHTVIATSTDGIAWTARTTPLDSASFTANSVVWSSTFGVFFATSFGGGAMTSPDGVTWSPLTITGQGFDAALSVSDDLGLVFCTQSGGSSSTLSVSSDGGSTWTDTGASVFTQVTYSSSLGYLEGGTSDGFYTSPDGFTWTVAECIVSVSAPAFNHVIPI